jgi:hypothetical protein
MNQIHQEVLDHKKIYFFVMICLFSLGIAYLIQYFFYSESVFYATYAGQFTSEQTEKLYENTKNWQWISLILFPLLLIAKVIYNAFWITAGSLLHNEKIMFKTNFNVCLKAEYIFVLMLVVKFIWLLFFKQVNNLTDLSYVPGSLLNFYTVDKIPPWGIYPLQIINIWELLFCIIGTSMYSIQYNLSTMKAAQLFCIPYLSGLFIWVLTVVFLTLQFT